LYGESVAEKLKDSTKAFHGRTFERLRLEMAKQDLGDNAIPTLRQANKAMAFFRLIE